MDADYYKQATAEIWIKNSGLFNIQGLFIRVRVHSKLNFDLTFFIELIFFFLNCCDKLLGLYTQDVIVF